jgi:hypothetical protein
LQKDPYNFKRDWKLSELHSFISSVESETRPNNKQIRLRGEVMKKRGMESGDKGQRTKDKGRRTKHKGEGRYFSFLRPLYFDLRSFPLFLPAYVDHLLL